MKSNLALKGTQPALDALHDPECFGQADIGKNETRGIANILRPHNVPVKCPGSEILDTHDAGGCLIDSLDQR
ncbi:hypothetical protein, partial [Stenotrophomonas sp. SrG]|uniref:hypothetical protein n=1 Tax=Stenotrophomonas sp. SrG TaxID=3414430 RepID=UPI003CF3FBEB